MMEVLWEAGEATVADVTANVGRPPLAYNTVLSTLRTLEQKGYVAHEEEGRAFVYRATVERTQAADSAVRQLLRRFFGDSPGQLAVALLDAEKLTSAEVAQIQQILARRGKARK